MIERIHSRSPFVFSTSLPAALCTAAEAAVDLVERDVELRERLWRNIRRFAKGWFQSVAYMKAHKEFGVRIAQKSLEIGPQCFLEA